MSLPAAVRAPADGAVRTAAVGELAFESHGARVHVRSDDGAVLALLRQRLPPGARRCHTTRPDVAYHVHRAGHGMSGPMPYVVSALDPLTGDAEEIARSLEVETVVQLLVSDAEFQIALHAPVRLFIHAAAVAWNGSAIVIPGPTFSGKSTLAAALVRAGARYLSDEFTILDEAGLVHPFPRPLHLRSPDGRTSRVVPADELGAVAATPLPLGAVVWTTFRPGARWRPTSLTRGQTALALLDNTVVARTRPTHAMARIARAVQGGAPGLRGARGEADETARWLLAWAGHSCARSSAT